MKTRDKSEMGLTLTELLVAMALIALLAGLSLPMCVRARARAHTATCGNHLAAIGQAYALRLTETQGCLPDAYYAYEGGEGVYAVTLRQAGADRPDPFFNALSSGCLRCPSEEGAVDVLATTGGSDDSAVASSYAYNVSLPILFDNAARVANAGDTVTFYDGDPSGCVGEWQFDMGWAASTVRNRHAEGCNYLFLDGHVDCISEFPDVAFQGGSRWLPAQNGGDGLADGPDWGWSKPSSLWNGTPAPVPTKKPIPFTIQDGTIKPERTCKATVTCLGAALQYGAGGPRIPVQAYGRVIGEDDDSWKSISQDVMGGETMAADDLAAGRRIAVKAEASYRSFSASYSSDDRTGHCWVLRNGDDAPMLGGFETQPPISDYVSPFTDGKGKITIGVNEAIFLFELSAQTDYRRYSWADFQDLVVLVSLSE